MAASEALHAGSGFTLSYSSNGSSYTEIAEVVDCTTPEFLVKEAKATHHSSPDNSTEAKPGLSETGKGMFTLNFTQSAFDAILALRRSEYYWKFTFPLKSGQSTAATLVVIGFWSKLGGMKFDPEDANVIQVQGELTRTRGLPTFTAGS